MTGPGFSGQGAKATGEISLAGRFLVLIPFGYKVNISKKIGNPETKKRLKDLVKVIKPINFGMIIRTVAEDANDDDIKADLNELLSGGGMSSMLSTIWLIMCAITFGSIMERLGLLKRLVIGLIGMAQSTGSLILVTALTCIGVNILAADQYISIVLPGRMYRLEFKRRNLAAKNLSRALEDTGTVTSVLVPWNTCGAFFSSTLGISTFAYAPYCFFNLISPIMSVFYGFWNIKISAIDPDEVLAE